MKKIAALILAALLTMLCACGAQESAAPAQDSAGKSYVPSGVTIKKPAGTDAGVETPENKNQPLSGKPVPLTDSQQFSADAGVSVDALREEIGQTAARFGMAYIGSFDDAASGELQQRIVSAAGELVYYYPFITEIDEAHTVGTQGDLYCIVAADYAAAIEAISADGETLYRSDNGDPILLFCGRNGGAAVVVTAADGTAYRWEPKLDETGSPCLLIGDERELLSYDFSIAPDSGLDWEGWFAEGWLGPAAAGIAGENDAGMEWQIGAWDGSETYCLSLYPSGEATLAAFCADDMAVQAQWQGGWRLETELDQPSRLELELTLKDGADMAAYEYAAAISEEYRALIHPSGERLLLVAEYSGALSPMFPEGAQTAELALCVG